MCLWCGGSRCGGRCEVCDVGKVCGYLFLTVTDCVIVSRGSVVVLREPYYLAHGWCLLRY